MGNGSPPDPAARLARRLRLRDLHTLLVVLDSGSMAGAAANLALTQPAISKAMAEMEATLGVPLLERGARGVRPTAFGEALAARARVMLDELEQGTRDLAHMAGQNSGQVRVGTTEPMSFTLAAAIRRLRQGHAGITFDIAISDTGSLLDALRARRLDVVVTRFQDAPDSDDLDAEYLFRVPLVVMADRGHPLCRRRGLGLAALLEEAWTLSPPETYLGRLVAETFRAAMLPMPPSVATSVSIAMRLSLVAEAGCITMLPRTLLHHPPHRAWLRALDVRLPGSAGAIGALTLRRRWMPGPVRLFLAALRETAPHTPGVDPLA